MKVTFRLVAGDPLNATYGVCEKYFISLEHLFGSDVAFIDFKTVAQGRIDDRGAHYASYGTRIKPRGEENLVTD